MAGDGKKVDPTWRMQTKMVRGGLDRSALRETAEAISMTSGFVYDNAEDAEAAFKGEVTLESLLAATKACTAKGVTLNKGDSLAVRTEPLEQ